jgi:Ca-activated chloride channel homolog
MKTFDANDPTWTAFALGELKGEDAAAFEAAVAQNEDAAAFVADTRAMAALLETQLEAEPMPELTAGQRETIQNPPRPGGKVIPFRWLVAGGSALAAAAIALFAVGLPMFGTLSDPGGHNLTVSQVAPEAEQEAADEEDLQTESLRQDRDGDKKSIATLTAEEQPDEPSLDPAPIVATPTDANRAEKRGDRATNSLRVSEHGRGKGRFAVDPLAARPRNQPAAKQNGRPNFGWNHKPADGAPDGRRRGYLPNQGLIKDADGRPDVATGDEYAPTQENPWKAAMTEPLSTFSVDVDTASYANVRRMLTSGMRPPADAVRIEELINYFDYDYPQPTGPHPFAVATEVAPSPWNAGRKLVRVGLQGKDIDAGQRPSSNLVFLVDVSGSMASDNKLGLLRRGLKLLVEGLTDKDRVAIVVYAGASGLVLPSTPGNRAGDINDALNRLRAGGSTNGGAGIELAYAVARRNFIQGGTNRVILCTDGDFNVGVTNRQGLVQLATQKAKSGVFLTVLGFGMGNFKDATLEQIANKANGAFFYIDNDREARKVLVDELSGTLVTIAKDVKIQVEFNPARVSQYRLVGYVNRKLAHKDFNDDKKDAGEIGAGHTVTALYEVVPVGAVGVGVDPLRYQRPPGGELTPEAGGAELLTLKLRYKEPEGTVSKLMVYRVEDNSRTLEEASDELKFAAAVAGFGMLLRRSPHAGDLTWGTVLEWADVGRRSRDPQLLRKEFVELVRRAQALP